MLRKSSFILIFCLLVQSATGSTKATHKHALSKTGLGYKTPQLADQTFHINNWGCEKIERKILNDIKLSFIPSKVHKRFKVWPGVI